MLDGFFAGIGYTIVLLIISFFREYLGFGTIFGLQANFLNFETWTIMVMPPAAFFLIGSLIWITSNIFSSGKTKNGK
jgi:Na+-transporting NADH:ubiquinone oxidoreductase subunit D